MHRLGNLLRRIKAWKNAGNPVLKEPSLSLTVDSLVRPSLRIRHDFRKIEPRLTLRKALRKKRRADPGRENERHGSRTGLRSALSSTRISAHFAQGSAARASSGERVQRRERPKDRARHISARAFGWGDQGCSRCVGRPPRKQRCSLHRSYGIPLSRAACAQQGLSGPPSAPPSSDPPSSAAAGSAPSDLSSRSVHAAARQTNRSKGSRGAMGRRLTHNAPKTKSPRIAPRAPRSGCSVACAKERTRTSTGVTPLEPESSASANSATLANRLQRRSRELPDVWPPVKAGRAQLFS
ncbi:MAG: hypothetical protein RL385_924 [Pseudomonadota bacterium]